MSCHSGYHSLVLKNPLPLKVHCWGGFGSQLFALALVLDIERHYKSRKIHIDFHTSGVTERKVEISDYLYGFSYSQVRDYNSKNTEFFSYRSKSNFFRLMRNLYKHLLVILRILVYIDEKDLKYIRPWTLQIRGHYSYRKIDVETFETLMSFLKINSHDFFLDENFRYVFQYRLGDLVFLKTKDYVNLNLLEPIFENLMKTDSSTKIIACLTDSPELAKVSLAKYEFLFQSIVLCKTPNDTIDLGFRSEIFIGTNSKISLWIVILRLIYNKGLCFLPNELLWNVRKVVPHSVENNLKGY